MRLLIDGVEVDRTAVPGEPEMDEGMQQYLAQNQHLNHEPPTAWNTLSSNEL
jgi:hypothetical protein